MNKLFSISKLHINDISLSGKIHEKDFIPGPILYLFLKAQFFQKHYQNSK